MTKNNRAIRTLTQRLTTPTQRVRLRERDRAGERERKRANKQLEALDV